MSVSFRADWVLLTVTRDEKVLQLDVPVEHVGWRLSTADNNWWKSILASASSSLEWFSIKLSTVQ